MKSPFKFLDSYTKEDKNIFFGRDKETEELYQKVFESKVLLVYGVSGTGKSSLIHCGLANKFQDSDWLPINIRRGANINDSLVKSIEKEITSPPPADRNDENKKRPSLKKLLRNLYLDNFKPIYLIFDQFEELFIFGSKPEREDFIKSVKTIVDSDLNCKFLFVIREEYLAGITEFEKQLPQIMQNRIRIEKMGRSNAIQAIEGPCKYADINLEEGFSEALIEKLSPDSAEVELTYLQVYLDKLFKVSDSGFTKDLIESFGNVKDLLGSFLDEQIAELESPEEGLTILKAFVSSKGTKRQITESEVTDYALTLGKKIESEQLKSLIQKFISLRILRDKDENNRYELRHDALAAKIYEKITLVEKELLEVRQFIENGFENFSKRKVLFSRDDLEYIAPYENKLYLKNEIKQFIINSWDELEKAKRRKRLLVSIGTIILLIVFAGFTWWALNERNKAVEAGKGQIESIIQLNQSIGNNKAIQEEKIKAIYSDINNAYKSTPYRLSSLWQNVESVRTNSQNICNEIQNIIYHLIAAADNITIEDARKIDFYSIKNIDDTKSVQNVLFEENKAEIIKNMINDYHDSIFNRIEQKDWDKVNRVIRTQGSNIKSWEEYNFSGIIVGAAITCLNNIIVKIINTELEALNYYQNFISYEFKFDRVETRIFSKSNYVIQGDKYSAELLLLAYNSNSNMEAYIYNEPPSENYKTKPDLSNARPFYSSKGVINIELEANEIGEHNVSGVILNKIASDTSYTPFQFNYIVALPSASIIPIKSNILYIGLDNPISISVPGIPANNIHPVVDDTKCSIRKVSSINYIVNVKPNVNTLAIGVKYKNNGEEKNLGTVNFKVKRVPNPIFKLGNETGGRISKDKLINLDPTIVFEVLDLKYNLLEFSIRVNNDTKTYKSKDAKFSNQQIQIIKNTVNGDIIKFENVFVTGQDGTSRKINELIFQINKNRK